MLPHIHRHTTSVLVFERHALIRAALRGLIDGTEGLTAVAEASSIDEAVDAARTVLPHVVLMDGRDDEATRDAAVSALKLAAPDACILVLADDTDGSPKDPSRAAERLPSDVGVREFCATIAMKLGVHCAGCALSPVCRPEWDVVTLSRREKHVAVRVAAGLTSKQIAGDLGVSLRTVHTYRESLARKLGASSAAVVTRFVIERNISEGDAAS